MISLPLNTTSSNRAKSELLFLIKLRLLNIKNINRKKKDIAR